MERVKTGGLVVPVFEKEKSGKSVDQLDRVLDGSITRTIKRGDFSGTIGTAHLMHPEGRISAERVVLVGLGKRKDVTLNRLRQAGEKQLLCCGQQERRMQ